MKSARSANSQQSAQSQSVQQPQSVQARRRVLHTAVLAAALFLCLLSLGYCVLCAGTLCPTSGLLGLPCPLCGMSRALMLALCVAAVLAIYTLRMLALFPDHSIMCFNERALVLVLWGNA